MKQLKLLLAATMVVAGFAFAGTASAQTVIATNTYSFSMAIGNKETTGTYSCPGVYYCTTNPTPLWLTAPTNATSLLAVVQPATNQTSAVYTVEDLDWYGAGTCNTNACALDLNTNDGYVVSVYLRKAPTGYSKSNIVSGTLTVYLYGN